ncbi:MAG: T9SS type A sorting domain-containing protein [Ignavibacteriaceae bacterium]
MEWLKKTFILCLFFFPILIYSFPIADSSYFPMALGNKWNYTSTQYPDSVMIVDTLSKNGFLYFGLAGTSQAYWFREKDNRVYFLNPTESNDILLFDFTLDVGDSIELPTGYECSFGRRLFLVSKTDTIVTPAGTFYNCYHFKHKYNCFDAGIHDTWFAKNIGKVKQIENSYAGINIFVLNSYSIITTINTQDEDKTAPSFTLYQNYPNPFNPITNINYDLAIDGLVKMEIFNIIGTKVAVLLNEFQTKGMHSVSFDASGFPSGIYFYSISSLSYFKTKKMIFLK